MGKSRRRPGRREWARCLFAALAAVLLLGLVAQAALAQGNGRIDCRIWTVASGQPVESRQPAGEGVRVRLSRDGGRIGEATTSGDGGAAFTGLAAGAYVLEVIDWPADVGPKSASGGQAALSLADGQTQTANIVLVFRGGGAAPSETEPLGVPDPGEAVKKAQKGLGTFKKAALELWTDHRPIVIAVVALLLALTVLRKLLRRKKPDLRVACAKGLPSLAGHEKGLGPIDRADPEAVVDLFMAYRDSHAFDEMFSLYSKMPAPLQQRLPVRQQYAFALNRAGRDHEAEGVLKDLLEQRGPSPETCGILGRIYKDRWDKARESGAGETAKGLLNQAIDAYIEGHEADPGNPYPGINVLTLAEHSDSRREELSARFRREVSKALDSGAGTDDDDYWRQATRLELAMHLENEGEARAALQEVLKATSRPTVGCPEIWKARTTLRNQRLIVEARDKRGEPTPDWARQAVSALERAAG